jgi:hypothetical protein
MNPTDFINVEQFLFDQGFYNAALNNTSTRPLVSPVVEIILKKRNGLISPAQSDSMINILRNIDVRNDYEKYFYRNQVDQQYSLGLSGGSANLNYYINFGYDKSLSALVGNNTERASLNSVTNFKPFKKLEIQAGINYSVNRSTLNGISAINPGSGKSNLYPYAKLADENGNPLPVEKDYRMSYLDTAGSGLLLDWKYRPLDELNFADNTAQSNDLTLQVGLKLNLTKKLLFEIRGELENTFQEEKNYSSVQTYTARNIINRFSQRTASGIKRNVPYGGILDYATGRLAAYGLRSQLSYNTEWLTGHHLNILAGAEIREAHTLTNNGRTYGYNNDLLTYSNVDYITNFTLYGNLGSGAIPNPAGYSDILNRYVSLYSNLTYSFKERYFLFGSARKDASNLFGVSSNNRGTPLWSSGAAWQLSQEPFYRLKWMPFLKLRFTYGFSGNVDNSMSALPKIVYMAAMSPTNLPSAIAGTPPNPDLKWEKVRMINMGIDFVLRNERISGSIEYYSKNATNLLSPAPVDPTLGVTQFTKNVANLSGKGVDLNLNIHWTDKIFKWESGLLFSYVSNKVTRYLIESSNKGSYAGLGYTITPIEGQDPYAIISYRWAGLDSLGDPKGYLNKTISKDYSNMVRTTSWDDMVIQGTSRPPLYGSLINTVSWKGISLSFGFAFRFQYYFRKNSINYYSLFNSWIMNRDFENRWQKPGDEWITNVPAMSYPANSNRDKFYLYSEATVLKGDLFRLQDLRITYDFPDLKLAKRALKKLQLYTYINNIGILWRANKEHLDPDYGGNLPPQTSFSFGIKTEF